MRNATSRFPEIARWLVSRYPAAWRQRYEEEMLALLEESSLRVRDLFDLARGLIVERARASFEPGDRPRLTHVTVTLTVMVASVVVVLTPAIVGLLAKALFGPLPPLFADLGVLTLLFCAIVVGVRRLRVSTKAAAAGMPDPAATFPPFAPSTEKLLLSALVVIGLLMGWGADRIKDLALYVVLCHAAWSAPTFLRWPIAAQMTRAVHQLRATAHELKWAQMELARCEQLTAAGAPAPLAEARAAIEDIRQRREAAIATLHGLGYRARLSRP